MLIDLSFNSYETMDLDNHPLRKIPNFQKKIDNTKFISLANKLISLNHKLEKLIS